MSRSNEAGKIWIIDDPVTPELINRQWYDRCWEWSQRLKDTWKGVEMNNADGMPRLWVSKDNDVEHQCAMLFTDPDPANDDQQGRNDALAAVLFAASCYVAMRFAKKLTVTSVHRTTNDPNRLHRCWRAFDARIARTQGELPYEITPDEAKDLCRWINQTFVYGETGDGRKTDVAKYRAGGTDSEPVAHIHFQVPDNDGTWS